MTTKHKDEIIKMKRATFVIRTSRGHYIRIRKADLRGFFAQYKATETMRAKEHFTTDIYTYSDGTIHVTIGE